MLAKHTKSFNLVDTLSVGVDRIQQNFEPMQRQVELWRKTQITDDTARLIFYSVFIDGKLEAPRSLLPDVRRLFFDEEMRDLGANGSLEPPIVVLIQLDKSAARLLVAVCTPATTSRTVTFYPHSLSVCRCMLLRGGCLLCASRFASQYAFL